MTLAFIHGLILAIGLILPIGMQNGFILTQGALHKRFWSTLPTVITAGFCDTLLISLAVLGVSSVALHIPVVRYGLGIIGVGFLLYIGWTTWPKRRAPMQDVSAVAAAAGTGAGAGVDGGGGADRATEGGTRTDRKIEDSARTDTPWSTKRQITFTLSVSLLNPHALIDTLAVLGGSALAYSTWPERITFGLACVLVSWFWFFFLAVLGHFIGRAMMSIDALGIINRVSAVMMWASAFYLVYIIYAFGK